MAKVAEKQPIVQEIGQVIDGAQSVLLVQYLGLTVEQDTALRRELRGAGVEYKVFKNTMMNLAFKETACEPLIEKLAGPNAIAVHKEDPTAAARILAKYAKQHECFNMIAGIVEGKYVEGAELAAIAAIPGREELLGRLFGSMQSPIANFARVLNQIAEKGPEAAAEEAPAAEEAAPAEEAPAAEEAAPAEAEAPVAEEAAPAEAEAPAAEEALAEEAAPAEEAPAEEEAAEEAPAAEAPEDNKEE